MTSIPTATEDDINMISAITGICDMKHISAVMKDGKNKTFVITTDHWKVLEQKRKEKEEKSRQTPQKRTIYLDKVPTDPSTTGCGVVLMKTGRPVTSREDVMRTIQLGDYPNGYSFKLWMDGSPPRTIATYSKEDAEKPNFYEKVLADATTAFCQ